MYLCGVQSELNLHFTSHVQSYLEIAPLNIIMSEGVKFLRFIIE